MKKCYLFILILSSVVSTFGQTQSIHVNTGWNLLSLPIHPTESKKNILFPSAVSDAFIFKDTYLSKDTLDNGYGFWVKFDSTENFQIAGNAIFNDTVEVGAGWNMIGSITWPIAVNTIQSDVPNNIISTFFCFSEGRYQSADTLQPGIGYWVKVNQDDVLFLSAMGIPCPGIPSVDYAGKTYNTVQIGDQCWFKENLDVGTMIAGVDSQKNNGTLEKYCYDNDSNNCTTYGGLYQWDEAMQYSTAEGARGICPNGWHIPTLAEYQTLYTTVGGHGNSLTREDQGSGAGQGTNTTGFSALLSGYRDFGGYFDILGYATFFWSSTEFGGDAPYHMTLNGVDGNITLSYYLGDGFSARCIKD